MTLLKLAGGTGIAAAIALAVSLLFMNHAAPVASAAEALKQATTATSGYQGWIHVQQVGKNPQREASVDINTQDDTIVMVNNIGGNKEVLYLSPVSGEYLRYDAKTNTITRNVNNAEGTKRMADTAKRQLMPDTMIEELGKFVEFTVKQSKEGDLERFDITNEGSRDKRFTTMEKLIVLVDPRTSLIQEMQVVIKDDDTRVMKLTYGGPAIQSIYDLGVPKDAKVVDASAALRPVVTQPDSGTSLNVRATVSGDRRYVTLNVRRHVSQFIGLDTFPIGNQGVLILPGAAERILETTVTVPDGGTLLIGGLKYRVGRVGLPDGFTGPVQSPARGSKS